jgi:hypothetical protein
MPKRAKRSSVLTLIPKDDRTYPNVPSAIEINKETLLKIKLIEPQRARIFKTRYRETDCMKNEIAANQVKPFKYETSPKARI